MTVKTSRRSRISPFLVMDVMEDARKLESVGHDVVHMEVGQPGTPAPKAAMDRLTGEISSGAPMGYTVALGLPELREGIARLYRSRHGVDLDPARVVITSGSSCALILAFLALFDAGDTVALADPGYPAYRNILGALDLNVARIEATLATGFQPTPADLNEAGPLNGLLVASPANPTGTMLDRAALTALIRWCESNDCAFISDEIYHGLTYGMDAVSALEVSDKAIVINSFAKYFSMTGWRIGWMVVPPGLIRTIENLSQNLFICPSHASQVAALGALDAIEELEAHRDVYAANRQRLLNVLPELGFTDIAPADGAFYIYAGIEQLSNDSKDFSARMLQEGGVAATMGLDFDPIRGSRTMRFSFARTEAEIEEGIRRIRAFLSK